MSETSTNVKDYYFRIVAGLGLFLLFVFILSGIVDDWHRWRENTCLDRAATWEESAKEANAVVYLYERAMSKASYVISQHIAILDAARDVQCVTREYSTYINGRRELTGTRAIPLEDKFSFQIKNLERETPIL